MVVVIVVIVVVVVIVPLPPLLPSKGHSLGPREVMKVSPNMVKGIYLSLLGRGFPTHLDDFRKK